MCHNYHEADHIDKTQGLGVVNELISLLQIFEF